MIDAVFNVVFANVMPYLAPIVLILCAFIVAERFIDLMYNALGRQDNDKRRDDY